MKRAASSLITFFAHWAKTWSFDVVMLIALGLLALGVRMYKIDTPLADWHSWRQADTASVTREYVKHNYAFSLPHYMDLSDIPSGLNNTDGYRMVEFPIENYTIAQLLRADPQLDLVKTSRLVSIFCSLIALGSLYFLVAELSKRKGVAFVASLVFALLPYSVYYSRVILPEPAMLMAQLVSLTSFVYWLKNLKLKRLVVGYGFYLMSVVFFALALLLKPMAIFIAPVFVFLAFYHFGWRTLRRVELWVMAPVVIAPMLMWRRWITQFPSGIPASSWLFNGNGIRLRPAWWRWLFADRIARLILGYWGVIFVTMGVLAKEAKQRFSVFDWVSIIWTVSMLGYLVVFATGNVQHDYYQAMLTPIVSILFARGIWWMFQVGKERGSLVVTVPMIGLIVFLTTMFSWNEVRGYYNINNPAIVSAGKAVDRLVPADARVIAPYMGDTAFLFQTNRTGWPIGGKMDEKIKLGAGYYVTTTYDDEAKQLEKKYLTLEKTPEYLIFDLTKTATAAANTMPSNFVVDDRKAK